MDANLHSMVFPVGNMDSCYIRSETRGKTTPFLLHQQGVCKKTGSLIVEHRYANKKSFAAIEKLIASVAESVKELKPPVYNKVTEVPSWGRAYVEKAIELGILQGTGNGLGLTPVKLETVIMLLRGQGVMK